MDYIIDCLYNFAVSFTCHIHDWGTVGNRKMFVDDFCNAQKITDKDSIKAIKKYSKYYLESNITWFPGRKEIEEWYEKYQMK